MLLAHTNIYITIPPDNDAPRDGAGPRTTNAPARTLPRGGVAQEVTSCLFSPHTTCIPLTFSTPFVLFHIRWEPPAARPLCRTTLPLPSPPILSKPPRETRARCLFRGATPLLILQFPQFPGHAHPNLAAFGRIPADHAVPVLVASPPPAGVWVGEARVHARPVAQARAAGEPGAVVARDGDARRPAADARRWEPVRESGNATSSRRHARAATRDHRRSHDGRWRLRGLARLRSALRRAGPAM